MRSLTAWHASAAPIELETTASAGRGHSPLPSSTRRPLPTPPVLQSDMRGISLLGERDPNHLRPAPDSHLESQKTARYVSARKAKSVSSANRPSNSFPPVPAIIQEADDEDTKSVSQTPRSRKSARERAQRSKLPRTSTAAVVPSRTPPNVTSRTKTRTRHRENLSPNGGGNEENIESPNVTTPRTPRTPAQPRHSVRGRTVHGTRGMR